MQDPRDNASGRLADRVLATHPEAQSLLFEAGHRRVLAGHSAREVARTFKAMQAARLAYEVLAHRLDPRRRRTVSFGVAVTLQAAIFAVLVALDAVEFTGVLAGWMRMTAVAAAAAWAGLAWLGGVAVRERKGGLLAAVAAGSGALAVLVTALHAAAPLDTPAGPRYGLGVGLLAAVLILALEAAAAALIARTEPASLLLARWRWHQARAEYEEAVLLQEADAEADAVAGQAWDSLLHAQAMPPGEAQERLTPTWPTAGNSRHGPGAHPAP